MPNKIDKALIILIKLLIAVVLIPILLFLVLVIITINNASIINSFFAKFWFYLYVAFYRFILPMGVLLQIIILILKIFSKRKTKKDWVIIFANMLLILAFSGLAILAFLSTLNPLI